MPACLINQPNNILAYLFIMSGIIFTISASIITRARKPRGAQ